MQGALPALGFPRGEPVILVAATIAATNTSSSAARPPRPGSPRTSSEKCDATTFALQETLQGFMTQKEARVGKKRQENEEQMKAYIEIQTKKLKTEENVQTKKLEIEAINVKTKAKEVALAFMVKEMGITTADLSKVSARRKVWFKKRQTKLLAGDAQA
ncbi:hypothetical protein D1007_13769 [Hordeum vulgare]|nr:hypothetical protein D1007_13769 [Hordeum vulgare]